MEPPTPDKVVFWLDDDNTIVRVNETWDRFAMDNEGDACTAGYVLGRRLRDFVTGDATQILVDTLILRARALGTEVERRYRCDSPTTKRFMQMRLVPDGGGLRFEHWLVRTEAMQSALRFVYSPYTRACVVRCSMCNRLNLAHGWSEPDARAAQPTLRDVIYGVCPDCRQSIGMPFAGA